MVLLYLKKGKCKISIIVFIAEDICPWLSPWLVKQMEMLSVYGRVTAKSIFLPFATVHFCIKVHIFYIASYYFI